MTEFPVILRGTPSTEGWQPPGAEHRGRSLAQQVSLYWHAAADANAEGDRFGLLAALIARGRLVLHGVIVVPDDLGARDPAALTGIQRWAKAHRLDTALGPAPWRVVGLSEFFDPEATREATDEKAAKPWAFVPNAYNRGAGPVVGVDHGRTGGLVAEHVETRTGRNAQSWQLWLPGWGRPNAEQGKVDRVSPHRPPLLVSSRRKGWSVRFGPCAGGFGTRGAAFLDLLTGAYVLDADRAAGFVEHARHFGVDAEPLPVTVTLDASGAARMAEALRSVHALGLALDEDAAKWFTTPQDRAEGTVRFPIAFAHSPAGVADHLLRRFRVDAPLRRFALRPEEGAAWWEAFHGGWNDADPAFLGRPFGAVVLDLSSAYPLTAHLVDWWDVMTANRLVRRSVLGELRTLCRRAVKDPTVVLDPAVWARFSLTLCEVVPDAECFPVALDDPARPDGRTETVPVVARGRTMFYAWPDVVAAAILSGRVPRIVRAVRLVPEGRQERLRQRVPIYPGLVLDADADPVLGLVRRRRQAKVEGGKVLAAELHAATNSLVSGNFERADDVLLYTGGARRTRGDGRSRQDGGTWRTVERAGPWTFAPLGVTVTAGARLLLAVMDRMARDLGTRVAYRDTDSSILPASPEGGTLTLPDGTAVHELSDAEVDSLVAAFDGLSPEPAWPVWKRTPGPGEEPLRCVIFGPKRHAEWHGPDDAPRLVDWTETGLGGYWTDPAALQGRQGEAGRAWSKVAVERAVRYVAAKVRSEGTGERVFPGPVPWDAADPSVPAFPAFRRLQVTSPRMLESLPPSLGAHLGSRFVETSSPIELDSSYVAIDPGGALDDWQSLGWVHRRTGQRVRVTTTGTDYSAVRLGALRDRADAYGFPPRGERVESATVTPLSVVYRGRVSPVLDASDDGEPGDLARFRVRYEDAHGLGPGQRAALVALARSMPASEFAALAGTTPRVARGVALGELPRPAATRRVLAALRRSGAAWIVPTERVCALDGCEHPVEGRRRYCACCPSHAERGRKRAQRSNRSPEPGTPGPAERKETR